MEAIFCVLLFDNRKKLIIDLLQNELGRFQRGQL